MGVIGGSKLEMLGGTTCSDLLSSFAGGIRAHGFPLLSEGTAHLSLGSLGSVNSHQERNRCPQWPALLSLIAVVRPRQYRCPVPPPAQCVTSPVTASALHGRENTDSLEVPAEPLVMAVSS